MVGSKNPMWKGDDVGYIALHAWVKRHLKEPKNCNVCSKKKPLDLANISQEYKRDLDDWEWLCRSCHMIKDGRIKNLQNIDRKGEKHGGALLNNKKVYKIRSLLESNISLKEIAKMFNVSISCIMHIKYKHTWSHLK